MFCVIYSVICVLYYMLCNLCSDICVLSESCVVGMYVMQQACSGDGGVVTHSAGDITCQHTVYIHTKIYRKYRVINKIFSQDFSFLKHSELLFFIHLILSKTIEEDAISLPCCIKFNFF